VSSYPRVLRHPDFRYLFLGQTASAVGDRVVIVALALFVTQRTGSPADLSLILAAQSAPLVALLLFGGVWADRLPRQRIMIATDLLRAALHGTLAVLIVAGAVTIWELAAIEALFGAAQAFFQPAYSGLLPQTVPAAEVQDARALTSSTTNLAFMAGPAIATAVVLTAGAGAVFAADAVTFCVSAALLMRVRVRPQVAASAHATVIGDLRAGWREVRSRSWIWVTIAVFAGAVLCVFAQWFALAPSIARDVYGNAGVFGLLEGVAGAGAVIGSVAAIRWRPAHPLRTGLLMVFAWPVQNVLFAAGTPLAAVLVCALMTGFGFSLLGVWWETALARHVPAHLLSRVSAWDWMGSLALLPVGFLAAAPLAGLFGARVVLGAGGVIGLALVALALVPRATRQLRGDVRAGRLAGTAAEAQFAEIPDALAASEFLAL
jgi:MFS family permease